MARAGRKRIKLILCVSVSKAAEYLTASAARHCQLPAGKLDAGKELRGWSVSCRSNLAGSVEPCERAVERPVRPVRRTPVEADDGVEADEGLSGLLAAVADEVRGWVAAVLAGLSGEFAARIAHDRKTRPKDQAAAVAALKQARKVAMNGGERECGERD